MASKAVADARNEVDFTKTLIGELKLRALAASAHQRAVYAEAHRPIYDAGRAIRLDAARMFDQASAMLAEAQALAAKGSAMIHEANGEGCSHPHGLRDAARLMGPIGTVESERWLWSNS